MSEEYPGGSFKIVNDYPPTLKKKNRLTRFRHRGKPICDGFWLPSGKAVRKPGKKKERPLKRISLYQGRKLPRKRIRQSSSARIKVGLSSLRRPSIARSQRNKKFGRDVRGIPTT